MLSHSKPAEGIQARPSRRTTSTPLLNSDCGCDACQAGHAANTPGCHADHDCSSPHDYDELCDCEQCVRTAQMIDWYEDQPHFTPCNANSIGDHAAGCHCDGCLKEIEDELPEIFYSRQEWIDDDPDREGDLFPSVRQQKFEREKERLDWMKALPNLYLYCGCPHPKCVGRRSGIHTLFCYKCPTCEADPKIAELRQKGEAVSNIQWLRSLSIVQICQEHGITLRQVHGVRYEGHCPVHNTTRCRFTVYTKSNRWHCNGNGKGWGDAADLLMALHANHDSQANQDDQKDRQLAQ